MLPTTKITYNCQDDEVKNLIFDYKKNINKFRSTIKKYIEDDDVLKHYLSNVSQEYLKLTILDKILEDKSLQKRFSVELAKFIQFYNKVICDENKFLNNKNNAENSISILHSNNDKLNNKLQEINYKFESSFTQEPNSVIELKNIAISLPLEGTNENNQFNIFNLSNRREF